MDEQPLQQSDFSHDSKMKECSSCNTFKNQHRVTQDTLMFDTAICVTVAKILSSTKERNVRELLSTSGSRSGSLSGGFITVVLKVKESVLVDRDRFMMRSTAGPTFEKRS